MIKKNSPLFYITAIVTLIPIVIGLILWNKLPDQIPIHWNIYGKVDAFSSKAEAVFVLPVFLLAIHRLGTIISIHDPKSENIKGKPLFLVFWICPVISLVCNSIMYATALGNKVNVEIIMPLFIGALFIVIGNYLPKCKQNHTIGIKIPWTLNDEENWNKTHRLAGFLWVISGIVIMATAFLGAFWFFFVMLVPMVVIPTVYSYLLYKKKQK